MMIVVAAAIVASFAAFCLLDLFHSPRDYPAAPWWRPRGLLAFALYLAVAFTAPMVWDAFLASHRLFDLTAWSLWSQIAVGFLVFELGMYVWHRTLHGSGLLWRTFHQTHHSAERIDIYSAYWFHPLDMIAWTLQASLCLVWIVGLSPEAAIVVSLTATFLGMFTHANLRTPRWLGLFIARPEMHAAHHERHVHGRNYCDLPIIDMIFGTYHNPRSAPREAGFYDGASARIWSLLTGRRLA